MKILVAHNRYLQPGGEDRVVAEEVELLRAHGHEVILLEESNARSARRAGLRAAADAIWSRSSYRRVREICRRERPDLMHVHNTLAVLSPSIFHAARAEGVATVQTLHNYRLLCPAGTMYRGSAVCETCTGPFGLAAAIQHRCYRGSRAATAAVAASIAAHRMIGTWTRCVDRFIALTDFARGKFIDAGLPPARVMVKPNFIAREPAVGPHDGGYALFVGRLSPEKGIATLLEAWTRLGEDGYRLVIAGDGPVPPRPVPGVEWLGRQSAPEVMGLMKHAAFLVFPSEWYEGFPMTILEAFGTGLPVLASRIGSVAEIVMDGETGIHFEPGDSADLEAHARWMFARPASLRMMGLAARRTVESRYTAPANYARLMEIYQAALGGPVTPASRPRATAAVLTPRDLHALTTGAS